MTCPFCGKEMEEGYLQSARPIVWAEDEKAFFPSVAFGKKDVSVTGMLDTVQKSYLCRTCNKIVTDLSDCN